MRLNPSPFSLVHEKRVDAHTKHDSEQERGREKVGNEERTKGY